jgi:hypothetical protein
MSLHLAIKVLTRYASLVEADLSPPLGDPGGPCQVMKRINDQVKNPTMRNEMVEDVSHGKDLSNQDASKIYPLDREPNAFIAKSLHISAHAQYRMDLRSVTVKDVQTALKNYVSLMQKLKSMQHPGFERMQNELASGKVEFVDPKTNLMVVFAVNGRESVTLISTYWKGRNDPKPVPPSSCKVASDAIELPEDPWKYFQKVPGAFLIPVSKLETIRARPTGIENAEKHMLNAYNGEGKKRVPVQVEEGEHGKFKVFDGNSTTAIAKKHGWKYLPVTKVTDEDRAREEAKSKHASLAEAFDPNYWD